MTLPYPGQDFTAFQQLPAAELDKIVANIEAIANGTGISDSATIPAKNFSNPYKFSVYKSSTTPLAANTQTKVGFDAELFDSNNNFDSTTNYRYTVPLTGYYQISLQTGIGSAGMSLGVGCVTTLYKNGTAIIISEAPGGSGSAATLPRPSINKLIYLVAGDYLEVYAACGETRDIVGGAAVTFFTGYLVSR